MYKNRWWGVIRYAHVSLNCRLDFFLFFFFPFWLDRKTFSVIDIIFRPLSRNCFECLAIACNLRSRIDSSDYSPSCKSKHVIRFVFLSKNPGQKTSESTMCHWKTISTADREREGERKRKNFVEKFVLSFHFAWFRGLTNDSWNVITSGLSRIDFSNGRIVNDCDTITLRNIRFNNNIEIDKQRWNNINRYLTMIFKILSRMKIRIKFVKQIIHKMINIIYAEQQI